MGYNSITIPCMGSNHQHIPTLPVFSCVFFNSMCLFLPPLCTLIPCVSLHEFNSMLCLNFCIKDTVPTTISLHSLHFSVWVSIPCMDPHHHYVFTLPVFPCMGFSSLHGFPPPLCIFIPHVSLHGFQFLCGSFSPLTKKDNDLVMFGLEFPHLLHRDTLGEVKTIATQLEHI